MVLDGTRYAVALKFPFNWTGCKHLQLFYVRFRTEEVDDRIWLTLFNVSLGTSACNLQRSISSLRAFFDVFLPMRDGYGSLRSLRGSGNYGRKKSIANETLATFQFF